MYASIFRKLPGAPLCRKHISAEDATKKNYETTSCQRVKREKFRDIRVLADVSRAIQNWGVRNSQELLHRLCDLLVGNAVKPARQRRNPVRQGPGERTNLAMKAPATGRYV